MSGQDGKFQLMDEASEKYKRLKSLLVRAGNPELPSELGIIMDQFGGRGPIRTSLDFSDSLKRYCDKIAVLDSLKPELERIANYWEGQYTTANDEAKAQLSADRIHLCC